MAHGPVLVTGGSGFVGRALLTAFAEADVEVHATYRQDQPTTPLANTFWHRVNLLEPGPVEALMRELAPERLVHLAWYVEHGRFWSAPENLDWVAASLHLLRAFAASGGRRVSDNRHLRRVRLDSGWAADRVSLASGTCDRVWRRQGRLAAYCRCVRPSRGRRAGVGSLVLYLRAWRGTQPPGSLGH